MTGEILTVTVPDPVAGPGPRPVGVVTVVTEFRPRHGRPLESLDAARRLHVERGVDRERVGMIGPCPGGGTTLVEVVRSGGDVSPLPRARRDPEPVTRDRAHVTAHPEEHP